METLVIDCQRLRNLTTGMLHTEMSHIYQDLEMFSGWDSLFTHQLPRVLKALRPWLKEVVEDERFWDGEYDTTHIGELKLPEPTRAERDEMFERYKAQPSPLWDKEVNAVQVGE